VNLVEAADRKVREYSKGMLQRIGLAQALVNEPELVFLDEPTSGLDPLGRRLVRDIIRELRERGTTVFLNSHLLGEVEVTCDRVVFIKAGRTLHEMALGGAEAATELELRVSPLDPETLAGLERFGARVPETVATANGVLRMKVPDDEALPKIARWLVGRGVSLYEMRTAKKSLEAWFLEAMGDDQGAG
jgi:ABC-2 type transport system ATP-binding protein